MIVTVACEHSPIFMAYQDSEGLLTLDSTNFRLVLEWHNSLTNSPNHKAYYQPEPDCFVFPTSEGEWEEFHVEPDGTYLCPDWLQKVAACPECLCYTPCDCEHQLLNEGDLQRLEAYALVNHDISMEQVRNLIYTVRELEAQLKVEQEDKP